MCKSSKMNMFFKGKELKFEIKGGKVYRLDNYYIPEASEINTFGELVQFIRFTKNCQ